jgi:D-3-phosphoglycerate dehydrogenase / 2-oxoglutarate reductase
MAPDDVAAHGASPVSFDDLIEHADYPVIQAPLTKETYHRIGEAELRRMKPTLILVNTARGPIVKDDALYLALKERWIADAGLDDLVITAHAAYYSEEAIRTVRDFAAHEVARVPTGPPPLSPVNAA